MTAEPLLDYFELTTEIGSAGNCPGRLVVVATSSSSKFVATRNAPEHQGLAIDRCTTDAASNPALGILWSALTQNNSALLAGSSV